MFYKKYGNKFNEAMRARIKKTRPQDLTRTGANSFPEQSSATAPKLDISKTRADLGNVESRNLPDIATPLVQNGTIRIPMETVASGKLNAIFGDYAHELANLVDYQMNQTRLGKAEETYGDPKYVDPNTGQPDRDTGAQVEILMFGSTQY